MVARGMTVKRPVAKIVLVACGICGCSSGPTVQTAEQETTVQSVDAVGETEAETELADQDAGTPAFQKRWRSAFKKLPNPDWTLKKPDWWERPAWLERIVKRDETAPTDPFIAAHAAKLERNAEPLIDYTPVVVRPASTRETEFGLTRDVIRLDGLRPRWLLEGTPTDATPVTIEPRQPENPFAAAETTEAMRDSSPVAPSSAEVRTTSWSDEAQATSVDTDRTISTRELLNRSTRPAGEIVNGDMIINSSLVPSRARPVRPASAETKVRRPGEYRRSLPRRPLDSAASDQRESRPTARANQPVSVAPEIPSSAERGSVSNGAARANRAPLFSGAELFRGAPRETNPFASVEGTTPSDLKPQTPGSVSVSSSQEETAPVVAARPEVLSPPVAGSVTSATLANVVDLTEAKRLARKQSQSSETPHFGTPVAIGLGLAAVATGAVMIRDRLV